MSEMVAEIRSTRQEEADACLPLPPGRPALSRGAWVCYAETI